MEHTLVYTRWKTHGCEQIPYENMFTRVVCVVCADDKSVKKACLRLQLYKHSERLSFRQA